ncbi:hypothetical protein Droror1_Dr00027922 [Drosera rotundifolia]
MQNESQTLTKSETTISLDFHETTTTSCEISERGGGGWAATMTVTAEEKRRRGMGCGGEKESGGGDKRLRGRSVEGRRRKGGGGWAAAATATRRRVEEGMRARPRICFSSRSPSSYSSSSSSTVRSRLRLRLSPPPPSPSPPPLLSLEDTRSVVRVSIWGSISPFLGGFRFGCLISSRWVSIWLFDFFEVRVSILQFEGAWALTNFGGISLIHLHPCYHFRTSHGMPRGN